MPTIPLVRPSFFRFVFHKVFHTTRPKTAAQRAVLLALSLYGIQLIYWGDDVRSGFFGWAI